MHPTRTASLAHLHDLATEGRWQELYQRTILWDFPQDALLGFQLAFYRPFAVPRMAAILTSTGQFAGDTEKRSYDTGLIMYEIINAGLDDPTARRLVGLMNRMHRPFPIEQADFTYILNAFIVVPLRHLDRIGWRPLLDVEREASWRFYCRLGELMGLETIPGSYQDAARMLDDYEARMVAASPSGRQLGDGVLQVLRRRLPLALRPWAAQVNAALIGDPRVAAALGLPNPGPAATGMRLLAAGAAHITRRRPAPSSPWFIPGQPAGRIYAHGYRLEDLGPATLHAAPTTRPRHGVTHPPSKPPD